MVSNPPNLVLAQSSQDQRPSKNHSSFFTSIQKFNFSEEHTSNNLIKCPYQTFCDKYIYVDLCSTQASKHKDKTSTATSSDKN